MGIGHIKIGPRVRTVVITDDDGSVTEAFYDQGELHRDNAPAVTLRRFGGATRDQYWRRGTLHRDDGPAWIDRNPDGSGYEAWFRDGMLHRDDGPAATIRYADGSVEEQVHRNGVIVHEWEPEHPGYASSGHDPSGRATLSGAVR